MRWSEVTTPEHVFGSRDKPFRYGERVVGYCRYLVESESSDLTSVVDVLQYVAGLQGCELHALIAGSCLQGLHGDVDILVGTYPERGRLPFVDGVYLEVAERGFVPQMYDAMGSYYDPFSMFLLPKKIFAMGLGSGSNFDINFVSGTEEWEDVLRFHERLNLVHSVIV